jgi:hypothetical protein
MNRRHKNIIIPKAAINTAKINIIYPVVKRDLFVSFLHSSVCLFGSGWIILHILNFNESGSYRAYSLPFTSIIGNDVIL